MTKREQLGRWVLQSNSVGGTPLTIGLSINMPRLHLKKGKENGWILSCQTMHRWIEKEKEQEERKYERRQIQEG